LQKGFGCSQYAQTTINGAIKDFTSSKMGFANQTSIKNNPPISRDPPLRGVFLRPTSCNWIFLKKWAGFRSLLNNWNSTFLPGINI